jgi:hypothetical protein
MIKTVAVYAEDRHDRCFDRHVFVSGGSGARHQAGMPGWPSPDQVRSLDGSRAGRGRCLRPAAASLRDDRRKGSAAATPMAGELARLGSRSTRSACGHLCRWADPALSPRPAGFSAARHGVDDRCGEGESEDEPGGRPLRPLQAKRRRVRASRPTRPCWARVIRSVFRRVAEGQ